MARCTIKVTDDLRNVSYLHIDGPKVSCVLSNGTPASLFYAGFGDGEEAARIALARIHSIEDALNFCRTAGRRNRHYEVV